MRVPCVMRWPGKTPAGCECRELACTMDLLPTFARLAGTQPPTDRIIDGKDIWPLMSAAEQAKSPHEAFYFYYRDQLQAVRSGKWKLHLPRTQKPRGNRPAQQLPARLYDLNADIPEKNNLADQHLDIVERLLALAEKARRDIGDGPREGANQRPAGLVTDPKPLLLSSK
jgi:arylsulfatase A-like enzyme